ncbi:hypothetical protein FHW89_000821 [Mucilaginibacter sp. SG564]|nr:hypothetical protein [Mucilaginibacter sp. SG564]
MIQKFLLWYNALTEAQQKEILDYIFNNQIKSLNEGLYTGPSTRLEKGLFTGPLSSQNGCPTCKRPF